MIKVSVYLTAFYAVYSILLSMDTSYIRNRFFILSALTTSLILPFVSFHTSAPHNYQAFGKVLSDVFVSASGNGEEAKHSFLLPGFLQTVYSIYIIVAAVFMLKFFIDLINLQFLILKIPHIFIIIIQLKYVTLCHIHIFTIVFHFLFFLRLLIMSSFNLKYFSNYY